jgi:predicted MFS family arabinose efflux permease
VEIAAGATLLVDGALYLAIVPLLPELTRRFDLSAPGAAALLAVYPLVVLVVSLLSASLVERISPRTLIVAANAALLGSTLLFAFAPTALVLGLARAGQGIAGGIAYTAGLGWIGSITPSPERGASAGRTMTMTSLGTVIGPGIGALAGATSMELAFSLVAAGAAATTVLALATSSTLAAPVAREAESSSLVRAIRHPLVVAAVLAGLMPGFAAAALELLLPLRLGGLGSSATVIGAALVVGAALSTAVSPRAGRAIDRLGSRPVLIGIGALFAALALIAIPLAGSRAGLLVTLTILSPAVMSCLIVMTKLAADGADAAGVSITAATAWTGISWPLGAIVGPNLAGLLQDAAGLRVALAAVGALCLALVAACVATTRPRRSRA